jgi:hypothetical protein
MVSNAYKKKIKKREIASKYKDRRVALLKCRIISTANRKSECNFVVNKQHNIEQIIQNKLSKKQLSSKRAKFIISNESTDQHVKKKKKAE